MRRTFYLPLYEQKIVVIVSTDPPNMAAKKHGLTTPFARMHSKSPCQGATWDLPGDAGVAVYLPPKASVDTCAHEALHVAFSIADRAGLEWDVEDVNESLAYITGHVAQELYRISRLR